MIWFGFWFNYQSLNVMPSTDYSVAFQPFCPRDYNSGLGNRTLKIFYTQLIIKFIQSNMKIKLQNDLHVISKKIQFRFKKFQINKNQKNITIISTV